MGVKNEFITIYVIEKNDNPMIIKLTNIKSKS